MPIRTAHPLSYVPKPHHVPAGGDCAEARRFLPLAVEAWDAAGEELVEQGVAEELRSGDDGLRALNGLVNGVQHGGYGPLLRQGREEDR